MEGAEPPRFRWSRNLPALHTPSPDYLCTLGHTSVQTPLPPSPQLARELEGVARGRFHPGPPQAPIWGGWSLESFLEKKWENCDNSYKNY